MGDDYWETKYYELSEQMGQKIDALEQELAAAKARAEIWHKEAHAGHRIAYPERGRIDTDDCPVCKSVLAVLSSTARASDKGDEDAG